MTLAIPGLTPRQRCLITPHLPVAKSLPGIKTTLKSHVRFMFECVSGRAQGEHIYTRLPIPQLPSQTCCALQFFLWSIQLPSPCSPSMVNWPPLYIIASWSVSGTEIIHRQWEHFVQSVVIASQVHDTHRWGGYAPRLYRLTHRPNTFPLFALGGDCAADGYRIYRDSI